MKSKRFGETPFKAAPTYKKHADRLPIRLQDHGNPTRFKNIWVRELKPVEGKQVRKPYLKKDDGKEVPVE